MPPILCGPQFRPLMSAPITTNPPKTNVPILPKTADNKVVKEVKQKPKKLIKSKSSKPSLPVPSLSNNSELRTILVPLSALLSSPQLNPSMSAPITTPMKTNAPTLPNTCNSVPPVQSSPTPRVIKERIFCGKGIRVRYLEENYDKMSDTDKTMFLKWGAIKSFVSKSNKNCLGNLN